MQRRFSAFGPFELILAAVLLLSACATRIEAVNSLGGGPNSGSFDGLWGRATTPRGGDKREINILFFHGIGWTQQNEDFARDFELALARAHNLPDPSAPAASVTCAASSDMSQTSGGQARDIGGLSLRLAGDGILETDLPDVTLRLSEGGCLDRRVVETPQVRYNLYRFFWDNLFWDAFQYPHLGYDDRTNAGSEDIANMRLSRSRQIKDQLVTHGLSDAAMYIGPVGDLMREAGLTALCAAARDSATHELFNRTSNEALRPTIDKNAACNAANVQPGTFAIVTESLGSRIAFDTLRQYRDSEPLVETVMRQQPEVFMLANQLALVGLGDLHEREINGVTPNSTPATIVALSEVNDLLTYEIVPYVELLWIRSHQQENQPPVTIGAHERSDLVRRFGFEVVDLRLRFAGPALGFIPTVADPMAAHSGHAENAMVMSLIICGGQADQTGQLEASLDCINRAADDTPIGNQ